LCFTDFVLTNMTIMLPEHVADWVRRKAAEENVSVSRLIAKILARQMELDSYAAALEAWQRTAPFDLDADNRLSREDAHARG
jgi:hypothetical protein